MRRRLHGRAEAPPNRTTAPQPDWNSSLRRKSCGSSSGIYWCCPHHNIKCCPRYSTGVPWISQVYTVDNILIWIRGVDSVHMVWTTPILWVISRGTHLISRGCMVWTTHIPWVIWCGVHIWCGQRYGVDYMYPRDIKVLSTGYIWCGPYGVGDLSFADVVLN